MLLTKGIGAWFMLLTKGEKIFFSSALLTFGTCVCEISFLQFHPQKIKTGGRASLVGGLEVVR